jgi:hypothetical protein
MPGRLYATSASYRQRIHRSAGKWKAAGEEGISTDMTRSSCSRDRIWLHGSACERRAVSNVSISLAWFTSTTSGAITRSKPYSGIECEPRTRSHRSS